VGVSYTRAKWMQATEYLNAADKNPTKMISDLDVTHRLSVSGIYALPFGKGQTFADNATAVVNGLIGGWQVQGVYTYQTGFPVAFGTDGFYNGGDVAIDDKTTSKWFNTDAFTSILTSTATLATPVNHLRTLPLRFTDVRRDSINNLDLSLIKTTRVGASQSLQLRLEYINVFNEPYFAAPVTNPQQSTFGQISASNQANYARRAQVGVKLLF